MRNLINQSYMSDTMSLKEEALHMLNFFKKGNALRADTSLWPLF